MRISASRSLLLAWSLTALPCIAAPSPHPPSHNLQSLPRTPFAATGLIQALQPPTKAPRAHHAKSQPARRGSGGSSAAVVAASSASKAALGSFQLETTLFKTFTTIIPPELAASYMTDFLDIVALRIETGFWGHAPAAKQRVIRMWDFELSFCSLNTLMPWDFIQAYVLDLADHVARGFVGTFDEYLVGVIEGVTTVVTVKLKVYTEVPPMIAT